MTASDRWVLAGQVLIAGFEGSIVPPELVARSAQGALGGVILFRRNLGTMHEVRSLTGALQAARGSAPPLLVGVDQEGGRVARLGPPVLALPPMGKLAELDDAELTTRAAQLLGTQLKALGFNLNFAPVLDVHTNPLNPVIGDRAFGTTAEQVIRLGGAFARGLSQAGMLCCGKHFPGHGDTELDSHLALPRLRHARARLEAVELAPFRALGPALDAIMTAHVIFDALDPERPATLCEAAISGLLREGLGFSGVVVSDDLEMKAIADHRSIEAAAEGAIEAGADLLLICSKLDLLERAAAALARRAERDREFAEKLGRAAARGQTLRQRAAPPPDLDAELELREAEAAALAEEIRARLAARGATLTTS